MTIKQAIRILIRTNKWRRGAEIEMTDPKELGVAIDVAIAVMGGDAHKRAEVEEAPHKTEEA